MLAQRVVMTGGGSTKKLRFRVRNNGLNDKTNDPVCRKVL